MTPEIAWEQPEQRVPAPGSAEVVEVPDALLTPFERGPLRTLHAPTVWTRGAVYDADGALLPASQRIGGYAGDLVVSADPAEVDPAPGAEELTGTWLYGGHWMGQFGHFLTETLSTLWPEPADDLEGIVFHAFIWGGRQDPWQRKLVRRAGYDFRPRVVVAEPVRVERLLVPTRPYVLNAYALPEAAVPWRRVADSIRSPAGYERVYLSRSRYNAAALAAGRPTRSEPERDARLDETFAKHGFEVVFPEELPVLDQVRAVVAADVVAGATGSSLHLSVFAPPGARVIEVADRRTPAMALPAQRVLDSVCGQTSALIPYALDPNDVDRALAGLGL
jgi:capsular polysaccharide biosynthesis protein